MHSERPNILLITSDQQHWNTIGRYFEEVKTPNLDRLTREGTAFTRAYCPNPTCTPTRASLLTGQMPSRHGAWSLGTRLAEERWTMPGALSAAGYDTALIGKAHFQPLRSMEAEPSLESHPKVRDLDFWERFHGPWYGFDRIEIARNHGDEAHVGQHYALWMDEKGLPDWNEHFRNRWHEFDYTQLEGAPKTGAQEGAWSLPEEYHLNAWITERSCKRIDWARSEGLPFFLWASYFDPHPPYLVPEPWASMYDPEKITLPKGEAGEHSRNPPFHKLSQEESPDTSPWQETEQDNHGVHSHLVDEKQLRRDVAVYYGMVSMMDHYIGKLLDHLEAAGLAENTLVVFTSDHGHYYGHHGLTAKGPFHYEDGVRVPMLVRWPGQVPADRRCGGLQSLVDLVPTLMKAAGVPVPPRAEVQGVDQLAVWTGREEAVRGHVTIEHRHQPTAIHMRTYIDSRYKLTVYCGQPYGELYDLEEDPGEFRNLWEDPSAAAVKAELMQKLVFAELGQEPLPMGRVAPA